jgi:hypothetical protein
MSIARPAQSLTTREAHLTDNRQRAQRNQPTTDNARSAIRHTT